MSLAEKLKHCTCLLVLLCCLLCLIAPTTVANQQDDVKAKVQEALELFYKSNQPTKALAQLRELGAPAVPFVIERVRAERWRNHMDRELLLSFIPSAKGKESEVAVLELLSDRDPRLRGFAARTLGRWKLTEAIAHLVKLLDDKGIYLTTVYSHSPDEHKLVRDVAVDSLTEITGKVFEVNVVSEKKAKAWKNWWKRQQDSIQKKA